MKLARIQGGLDIVGSILFPAGIALVLVNGNPYIAARVVGSLIGVSAMALFVVVVFRGRLDCETMLSPSVFRVRLPIKAKGSIAKTNIEAMELLSWLTRTVLIKSAADDGDTLEIHGQRIRLSGIDAPESDQLCRGDDSLQYRCGAKSANELDRLIAGRAD